MIPTFDLRIGNWITESGVKYCVTGVSEKKVHFKGQKVAFSQENLHPIPITPEILKMVGFKQRGKTSLYDKFPDEGFTYELYSHKIMLFHRPDNTLCHWLNTRITFLHQLQNLYYYITGREINADF
jgi:hypothetical protein